MLVKIWQFSGCAENSALFRVESEVSEVSDCRKDLLIVGKSVTKSWGEVQMTGNEKEIKDFINLLVGREIEYVCCEAEILDIGFRNLILHGMGCTRVIQENDILITTVDYLSWDGTVSTNNDEWFNVERFRDRLLGRKVLSVSMNAVHDLKINLDQEITVECLIANAYPHYCDRETEQWVLFEHTEDRSGRFLTVYNKEIDFH